MLITLSPAFAAHLDTPSPVLAAALRAGFLGDAAGGANATAVVLASMKEDAGAAPFVVYWGLRESVPVGLCAFKRGLDARREVEISYYTFPDFEGRGVAGGMVEALRSVAIEAGAWGLRARTLPQENASAHVLRRHGFQWLGEGVDEAGVVWEWRHVLPLKA
jgi:RimJ/RimL family protein N-acetyltransferase